MPGRIQANATLTSVIQTGSEVTTENLTLQLTHAAGTASIGIEIDGNFSSHQNIRVDMNGAGTLTDAYYINISVIGNYVSGAAYEMVGTITNAMTDVSGTFSNDITIKAVI